MNKYFLLTFSILPLVVIAGVVALNWFGRESASTAVAAGSDKELAMYLEVRQILLERFDGELEADKLKDGALVGMGRAPGDRFTKVNPPIQASAQKMALQGHFYGIGVSIRGNLDGSIQVRGVVRDGPADRAGIKDKDVIVAVDGKTCLEQPMEATQMRIKGQTEGSPVVLSILRGGDIENGRHAEAKKLEITVLRGDVVSYSVHNDHIEEREGRKFGYLRISDFNDNTFDPQLKEALARLVDARAEGLVIDFRQNGGGKVKAAVTLIDAFIKEANALIVFTRSVNPKNRKDDQEHRTSDNGAISELPLVLLVDRNSASATEIVTGALKDHGRALVVGERTFGKGVVQSVIYLQTDPSYSVNVTTTQYFTPLGRKVQNTGDDDPYDRPFGAAGYTPRPGGIRPHVELPYQSQSEYDLIRAKLELQESRLSNEALLETDFQKKAWEAPDRMLEAALSLLAGKAVSARE